MDIEAKLVDKRALFHREFDLINQGEVRVRDLVILDYEVCESHVVLLLQVLLFGQYVFK